MSSPRTQALGQGIRVDHRSTCRIEHPRCKCPMSWWQRTPDGKRRRRSGFVGTFTDAVSEKAAAKVLAQTTPPPEVDGLAPPTLFGFAHARLSDEYAGRGQHAIDRYETAYRLRIHEHLGTHGLDAITVDAVEEWCDATVRREGCTRAVEYAFVTLRWLLNEAVRRRVIPHNPCNEVAFAKRYGKPTSRRDPDQKRALTAEEYARLREAAAIQGLESLLRVRLATEGALRRAELAALRWNDIDTDGATVRVDEAVTYTRATGLVTGSTKTGSSQRIIGIPRDLGDLIEQYRDEARDASAEAFLFAGRGSKRRGHRDPSRPITPHALTHWLRRLMERHGIVTPDGKALTTFHGLRRTGATLAIAAGVNPVFVQKQLGHANYATTERSYVELEDAGARGEFARAFT